MSGERHEQVTKRKNPNKQASKCLEGNSYIGAQKFPLNNNYVCSWYKAPYLMCAQCTYVSDLNRQLAFAPIQNKIRFDQTANFVVGFVCIWFDFVFVCERENEYCAIVIEQIVVCWWPSPSLSRHEAPPFSKLV